MFGYTWHLGIMTNTIFTVLLIYHVYKDKYTKVNKESLQELEP